MTKSGTYCDQVDIRQAVSSVHDANYVIVGYYDGLSLDVCSSIVSDV